MKIVPAKCLAAILFSMLICLPLHTIARTTGSVGRLPAAGETGGQSMELTPPFKMDPSVALGRTNPESLRATSFTAGRRRVIGSAAVREPGRFTAFNVRIAPEQINATSGSVGTGSGDINEIEPNDQVAQNVFMPANIGGQINPSGDQDFYAFPCFSGEQINIEAFASRIPGSLLVADIALFDSAGNMITESVGDGVNDPLIQTVATNNGIMIAGITDAGGFGGSHFVYLLSINGGVDVDEVEPNNSTPQAMPASDATVFGQVNSSSDTDLYSFNGTQGQTVIVDLDAALFGSSLVAALTLTDPATGIQYFKSDHDDGNDPRFNIVLPFTGPYVIGVAPIDGSASGFYRMNVSFVPGDGSPVVTGATHSKPKVITVTGGGFDPINSIAEVNGNQVATGIDSSHSLRAHSKARPGAVVTVANLPDLRRSNPIIVQ